jgi:hypothetical protein
MDIVLIGLMCLATMALGALFGALLVAPFEPNGPRSLFRHFLSAIVVALFVPVLPVLIWGTQVYLNRWDGGMNIALFSSGALAMALTALGIWRSAPDRISEYLKMIDLVKPFVIKNFEVLDGDEDGVLSSGDLSHAREKLTGENDLKLLDFVRSNLSTIGHGVGSYTTYNAATKTTSSKTVSVISRRDLDGFAERERAKYNAWGQ